MGWDGEFEGFWTYMGDFYQCGTIGIHKSKAHKLLVCRQAAKPLSRLPCSHPPNHLRVFASILSLASAQEGKKKYSHSAVSHSSLSLFFLPTQLSFPLFFPRFVSPHLLHFFSADALMSAHACCHRPPVRSSARHDWIELGRTGPNSTRLHRQTEPTGQAWNGTRGGVNVAR